MESEKDLINIGTALAGNLKNALKIFKNLDENTELHLINLEDGRFSLSANANILIRTYFKAFKDTKELYRIAFTYSAMANATKNLRSKNESLELSFKDNKLLIIGKKTYEVDAAIETLKKKPGDFKQDNAVTLHPAYLKKFCSSVIYGGTNQYAADIISGNSFYMSDGERVGLFCLKTNKNRCYDLSVKKELPKQYLMMTIDQIKNISKVIKETTNAFLLNAFKNYIILSTNDLEIIIPAKPINENVWHLYEEGWSDKNYTKIDLKGKINGSDLDVFKKLQKDKPKLYEELYKSVDSIEIYDKRSLYQIGDLLFVLCLHEDQYQNEYCLII